MNTNQPLPRRETLDYLEGKVLLKDISKKREKKKVIKKEVSDIDRLKRFSKSF
jgi:hypothetical protein